MNRVFPVLVVFSLACLSGCVSPRFDIESVRYSSWQKGVMVVREKAILIDTETGETWGLSFDKRKPTVDGYVWEKLLKKDEIDASK